MDPRRQRKATVLALITLMGLTATSTGTVARAASDTTCTFADEVVAAPGLTSSPSSGSITTSGETGSATCDGPVNGKEPTGPGTTGIDGRYGTKDGDTCQGGGEGDGVQSFTFPTSDGTVKLKNAITYEFGPFKAGTLLSGTFKGDHMSGTFEASPIDGDCASKPVTRYQVKAKGTIHD